MLFNSIEYLFIFLPVVFIIYFFLNKIKAYKAAKTFLLFASIYFYGSYKKEYVYIIICSIVFNYILCNLFKTDIKDIYKKIALISVIVANVSLLLFFKYFSFIYEIMDMLRVGIFNSMEIMIPLGISFFTLQQISFAIDYYKGKIDKPNFLDYSLYVCFFPQIVAGPIVRYKEMIPQFNCIKNKVISQKNLYIAIFLITIGLVKKTILADGNTSFITNISSNENFISNFYAAWVLGIVKTLQCYFDFSGYCDMALGSAMLFNISLPINFNSPFQVASITEFWQKWNMTLVRFMQDYIYLPMLKKANSEIKINLSIMFMFFIIGLWGFGIISIFYGILNGLFVCINRMWDKLNIRINKIVAAGLTFVSIVITMQLFFIENIEKGITLIKSMFGINANFVLPHMESINLVYTDQNAFSIEINILLVILGLILVFFVKNSNILARIYVKQNNMIYTFILAGLLFYSVLSITKMTKFIYFSF